MAYNPRKNCATCIAIEKTPTLKARIYRSKAYLKNDKAAESLRSIAETYHLPYNSIMRHCKNHQTKTPEQIAQAEISRIAKTAEEKTELQEKMAAVDATIVWDDVIKKGIMDLREGNIKLTANHLLKATKDKTDYDIKRKNQEMSMMQMIWHFASGAYTGGDQYDRRVVQGKEASGYDAASIFTGNSLEGAFGSSDIYNGVTGDAATSRPSEVLEGDDF